MSSSGGAAVPEPRPSEVHESFLPHELSRGYRPVSVGFLPPAVVSATPPVFPVAVANDGAIVQVGLALDVDTFGQVAKITVTRPAGAPFDDAARTAAAAFVFRPALRAGTPVRARVPYTITFKRASCAAV